jgi:hypothetical protein
VKLNGIDLSETARLRLHIAMETENAIPPPPSLSTTAPPSPTSNPSGLREDGQGRAPVVAVVAEVMP